MSAVAVEIFDGELAFAKRVRLRRAKATCVALRHALIKTVCVLDVDADCVSDLIRSRRLKCGAIVPLGRLALARRCQKNATFADGELCTHRTALQPVAETLHKAERLAEPFNGFSYIPINQYRNDWAGRCGTVYDTRGCRFHLKLVGLCRRAG